MLMGNKANSLLNEDHAINNMTFPFLRLPVELQVEVVNCISLYSDLKALCLTSKKVYDVATPRLYYKVDLRVGRKGIESIEWTQKYDRMVRSIHYLVWSPANLRFTRVLKTGFFEPGPTFLLGRLLSLLRIDSLIKFSYDTRSIDSFPTPLQVESLLGRQKHLQNLKLYSHMVPWFEKFLKTREPSQGTISKTFTKLDIGSSKDCMTGTRTNLCWPLRELDLCSLQNLSLNGGCIPSILDTLVDQFAGLFFANLTKLSLEQFIFSRTLALTNVPSLKSLVMKYCWRFDRYLALPDNFRLHSLIFKTYEEVRMLTPFLAHIKGLQHLEITSDTQLYESDDQDMIDFTSAVISHKDTLRVFEFNVDSMSHWNWAAVSDSLWDAHFVKNIQLCSKLVNLSLPVVPNQPTSYYRELIASFPSLSSLTVFTRIDAYPEWCPDRAMEIFPADAKSKSVTFEDVRMYRASIFLRQRAYAEDQEGLCYLTKVGEMTLNDVEAWKACLKAMCEREEKANHGEYSG